MPLKISVRSVLPARETGDLMVVGVLDARRRIEEEEQSLAARRLRSRARGSARSTPQEGRVQGQEGPAGLDVHARPRKADRLVLMGLGDVAKLGPGDIRTFAAKAARAANADKAKRLVLGFPTGLEGRLREVVEGLEMGAYRFTKYMTGDRKPKAELGQVTICVVGEVPKDAKERVDLGQTVAAGVNLARDLVERAAERPLSRGVRRRRAVTAKDARPQGPALRLQGDPEARDEPAPGRRPGQRA